MLRISEELKNNSLKMFIYLTYKDAPELSSARRKSSDSDLSTEKLLLVNPICPVRIMLEFIRRKCKLAAVTHFDLCDERGGLKGLFSMPTFAYAEHLFEHKGVYYLIILKQETEKITTILPQVNHENRLYLELQTKVKRFMLTGFSSPQPTPPKVIAPGKKK